MRTFLKYLTTLRHCAYKGYNVTETIRPASIVKVVFDCNSGKDRSGKMS